VQRVDVPNALGQPGRTPGATITLVGAGVSSPAPGGGVVLVQCNGAQGQSGAAFTSITIQATELGGFN
jgi:hypothetical protein